MGRGQKNTSSVHNVSYTTTWRGMNERLTNTTLYSSPATGGRGEREKKGWIDDESKEKLCNVTRVGVSLVTDSER